MSGNAPTSIWVVSAPQDLHSRCFDEIAISLHGALADLGVSAPVSKGMQAPTSKPIVLGAHRLHHHQLAEVPEHAVIYNLEQVPPASSDQWSPYLELLRTRMVWDYSARNVDALADWGVRRIAHCAIGHRRSLERFAGRDAATIADEDGPPVDVLVIGSMNARRQLLLEQLLLNGIRVVVLFGSYGEERDRWLARVPILLNVHFHETRVLELVRISYWLSNRRFVVSEPGAIRSRPQASKAEWQSARTESWFLSVCGT